jgi:hypothetical protein
MTASHSAELYSAVSRIFNPLAAARSANFELGGDLPNGIRRYRRWQIGAPAHFAALLSSFVIRHS